MFGRGLIFSGLVLLFWPFVSVSAQDSLKIDLHSGETFLLKQNFQKLAAAYQIDLNKALEIQAALWPNPQFSVEINAINPQAGRAFDAGSKGEKTASLEQVLILGGKKHNELMYAHSQTAVAALEFADLIRNLKKVYRSNFYGAWFDRNSLNLLNYQYVQVDSLVKAYQVQVVKGNIPLRDLLRLQALQLELAATRNSLLADLREEETILATLLATSLPVTVQALPADLELLQKDLGVPTDSLRQKALRLRPDLMAQATNVGSAEWMLRWQQSLAIPDLSLGTSYDQRGGAFNNQVNLTISAPLVLWNRNQGNIAAAGFGVEQAKLALLQKQNEIEAEVRQAFDAWKSGRQNLSLADSVQHKDYNAVWTGMFLNFRKNNISIIEFTYFVESYINASVQLNEIRKTQILNCIHLNWVVNEDIL